MIRSHAPGENDLYVRTLELGQVQESDFFSHTIHDDLDSIVQDIRQAHVTDRTTAEPQPTFTVVKEKFDRAMQLGSNEERVIHEVCDQMQIPFEKIASEDFSVFMRMLSLSKLLKNPNNWGEWLGHRHTMEQRRKSVDKEKTGALLGTTVFSLDLSIVF